MYQELDDMEKGEEVFDEQRLHESWKPNQFQTHTLKATSNWDEVTNLSAHESIGTMLRCAHRNSEAQDQVMEIELTNQEEDISGLIDQFKQAT